MEVVNEMYIIGNSTFGGILSITSTEGDMAGLDLPGNSLLFDFEGFLPQSYQNMKNESSTAEKSHLPDLRNTIYWDPNLTIIPGEIAEVSLSAPQSSGHYKVFISGMTEEGSLLHGSCSFIVED